MADLLLEKFQVLRGTMKLQMTVRPLL